MSKQVTICYNGHAIKMDPMLFNTLVSIGSDGLDQMAASEERRIEPDYEWIDTAREVHEKAAEISALICPPGSYPTTKDVPF